MRRLALAIEVTCARLSRALVGEFWVHVVNFSLILFIASCLQMKTSIWCLIILWRIFDSLKEDLRLHFNLGGG